jgi:acyl carrier protein
MSMTQAAVLERLQPLFDTLFMDPPRLQPELSARDVPEWDSLMQITLVVAVEKEFGIKFRVGEVETTRNVGDFADLILRALGA